MRNEGSVSFGRARQVLARLCQHHGVVTHDAPDLHPTRAPALPADSLLKTRLPDHHYEDSVQLLLEPRWLANPMPEQALVQLLQAFIDQPATPVSGLMRLRNLLVKPLGLRTSSLGCPVSSLLNDAPGQRFAQRFPVLGSHVAPNHAQVLLGADDKHLRFRSCVSVQRDATQITFTLSTRVRCHNGFGRIYMALVDPLHRHYIAPRMLQSAVAWLVQTTHESPLPVGAA